MENIDYNSIIVEIENFIEDFVSKSNLNNIVLGLSGGLDSAVTASLCIKTLGKDNVYALYLPCGEDSHGKRESKLVADTLDINYKIFDIKPLVDIYFKTFPDADRVRKGNMMARQRMAVLFDHSKIYNAIVAGTSNKSEILLGYFTVFGDGACSLAPIGDLFKTEVKEIAKELKIPSEIIRQKSTAGLWQGQADEEELGFSYEEADKILYFLEEKKCAVEDIVEQGFNRELVNKVKKRINTFSFKANLPVIPRLK